MDRKEEFLKFLEGKLKDKKFDDTYYTAYRQAIVNCKSEFLEIFEAEEPVLNREEIAKKIYEILNTFQSKGYPEDYLLGSKEDKLKIVEQIIEALEKEGLI